MNSKITLRLDDSAFAGLAAAFIAGLVREGVAFTALHDGNSLVVTLTGGF